MPRFLHTLPALLALSLTACIADDGTGDTELAITEGSAEAVGVLRFLNGPAADVETLDIDAALDVRAARNIVARVRGADAVLGTADDRLLVSIADLDSVSQVGPATIDRLLVYVESIGGVPRIEADGILLTAAEAAAIVAAANGATEAALDVDAALDARAARNLIAARPLADIAAVAAVSYVGASAIEKLRRWAPTWSAPPADDACVPALRAGMRACVEAQLAGQDPEEPLAIADAAAICADAEAVGPVFDAVCAGPVGAPFCGLDYETFWTTYVPPCADALAAELAPLCQTDADCAAPERCWGQANDGSSELAVCVDIRSLPGEGAECAAHADCAAGLVCAGLVAYDGWGQCLGAWSAGSFAMDVPSYVPASAGASVDSRVVVLGLATVPVDAEFELHLDGLDPRRLRISQADPNGNSGVIWDGAVDGAVMPARLLPHGGVVGDEYVNGAYTLTVTTLGAGVAGTLTWTMHMTSRFD